MANTPTLEKWQHARIRTVHLASGAGTVEIEPVDLADLLYGDEAQGIAPVIPDDLIAFAEKAEGTEIDEKKLPKEERLLARQYRYWLVSNRVLAPKMTPKDVAKLPYVDQWQLFQIALHMDSEERIRLAFFRGEVEVNESSNGSGPAKGAAAK